MSAVRNASTLCLSALLSVFTLALVAPDQAMASAKKDGTETQPPRTSILMVREDGQAIDPVTSKLLDEPGHYEEYDRYIDAIFRGIEGFCATKPKPCKLLFYFHGGLNNRESSVGRDLQCWNPQKHGDFGDFPFWDERFWDPKESTGPTSPIRRRDEVGCPTQTMTAGKANEVSPAAVQPARSLPQPPQ